jgi:EAL domain-containing protein (putative c-di-GMP-specific phosphodiesterase class I)
MAAAWPHCCYHASAAAVATSIVAIASSLGLQVVAEGVETREQLAFLRNCGCDSLQGYYFSRPVPAEEFAVLVGEGRRLE